MAAKKIADHTLYHLSPRGFWKKFRDVVVVNPEISSGLPLPDKHRYPQPGSRPELYSTPATKASDVAQNPYWKRDVRRQYPRLSVITQSDYSQILLASPQAQSIAAPNASAEGTTETSVSTPASTTKAVATLSELLKEINTSQSAFSESNLPPTPTNMGKWDPARDQDAPHDPHAYWNIFDTPFYGNSYLSMKIIRVQGRVLGNFASRAELTYKDAQGGTQFIAGR
ncbi:hypothetical protein FRC17_005941 [Serendipita sp. 399]|nr:hypothetical protein FRC17_005941 [Serendipita sp. 399]